MDFEWDEEKAAANLRKHGISFDAAKFVFRDLNMKDRLDDVVGFGEERSVATGMVHGELFVVVYTMRGGSCRIISARKANRHEQQDYFFED
jgi:uncharacterized protein